jgi:hypothetical protein
MMLVNEILRRTAYFGIRIFTSISLALMSLLATSPVVLLVLSIMDVAKIIPSFIQGRYLMCWLIVSIPVFIGFNIYVDYRIHSTRRKSKNNKQGSNDQ